MDKRGLYKCNKAYVRLHFCFLHHLERKNKSVSSFIVQTCVSRQVESLFLLFSLGATRGHDCKEQHREESHLWHALTDNVVEMEISCSNGDENEFAVVISSPTFLHHRGAGLCLKKQINVCFSSCLLFPWIIFYPVLDRQVSVLLSTPWDSLKRAFHHRDDEGKKKTFFFYPLHFLVWRARVTMATWHYTGQRRGGRNWAQARRGELSITLASALSHAHKQTHTHTHSHSALSSFKDWESWHFSFHQWTKNVLQCISVQKDGSACFNGCG